MPLGQSFPLVSVPFDLGLDAIPFFEVEMKGDLAVDVGFKFQFDFGIDNKQQFYWDSTKPDELSLDVKASLVEQSKPQFEATIGFLPVTLLDGHSSMDPTKHSSLSVGIDIDLAVDAANNISFTSSLQPNPSARVYVQAETDINDNFPNISTDFVMIWDGPDGPMPQLRFDQLAKPGVARVRPRCCTTSMSPSSVVSSTSPHESRPSSLRPRGVSAAVVP